MRAVSGPLTLITDSGTQPTRRLCRRGVGSVARRKRRRHRRLARRVISSNVRSGLGVLVGELAMFVSLVGVLLPLFVLAEIVVMSGCVVMSRRLI